MGELLTCPMDETPLVMAADDGVYESGCHRCRREYRFTRGVLKRNEQSPETKLGRHEVALHLHCDHEMIVLRDHVFGGTWDGVHSGPMTVTEQRAPGDEWNIVRVATSQKSFSPREPGDRAVVRSAGALVHGGLATLFATVLTVYFYGWAFLGLLPLGAVATAGAALWRWRMTSTRRAFDPLRLSHLKREQWLLEQLHRYRLERKNVEARMLTHRRQIGEMEKLAADMRSARGDYAHRLDVVDRGINALRHHHANDQRLQSAIDDAMEMVEFEYRAARALDYLPDDAIDRLSSTIAQLEAIEAENVVLEAQLEANAEVHAIAPN